jgi:hypothetical protein
MDRPPRSALRDARELGGAVPREIGMQHPRHHREQGADDET